MARMWILSSKIVQCNKGILARPLFVLVLATALVLIPGSSSLEIPMSQSTMPLRLVNVKLLMIICA